MTTLKADLLQIGAEIIYDSIIEQLLRGTKDTNKKIRKRKIWIRSWISRRHELGASNTLMKELALEDQHSYRKQLRMSTDLFETLLKKVKPLIQKKDTNMRQALPAEIKLQITLRFLATGDNYPTLAALYRVPECTISTFLKEVLDAIYKVLQSYITVSKTFFSVTWIILKNNFSTTCTQLYFFSTKTNKILNL